MNVWDDPDGCRPDYTDCRHTRQRHQHSIESGAPTSSILREASVLDGLSLRGRRRHSHQADQQSDAGQAGELARVVRLVRIQEIDRPLRFDE